MKPLKSFLGCFLTTLLFIPAAQALDIRSETQIKKSFLGVSGEFSQFKLEEGAISGSGVKVDFTHAFAKKAALEVFLTSAVNSTGGVQASFTGLGAYALYSLFGNCCEEDKTLTVDGKPVLRDRIEKGSSVLIGLGLDQFFLNGAKTVYSTSGLGLAVNYQFRFYRYNFKAEARHSQMVAGQTKIIGDFFSLGMVFTL